MCLLSMSEDYLMQMVVLMILSWAGFTGDTSGTELWTLILG